MGELKRMQEYIEWIKKNETPEMAKNALIHTGVLNEDGSIKDHIVNR